MDAKAPKPGELPPVIIMRPGDTRTLQIDLVPILRPHELACGATCDGATAARTRFGNTLELTVSPKVGEQSLTSSVRLMLGDNENVVSVPIRIVAR